MRKGRKADTWYLHQNWQKGNRHWKMWSMVREWDYAGAPWGKPCDEEAAKEDLFGFFDMMKQCRPDNYLNTGGRRGYYSFLINLLPLQQALANGKFALACHELQTLAAYEPIFQERIYYNLWLLHEKYIKKEIIDKRDEICYSKKKTLRGNTVMKAKRLGFFAKFATRRQKAKTKEVTALFEKECAFEEIMKTAESWIEEKVPEEQILLLDYIINVITEDLCCSTVAEILEKPYSNILPACCFPSFCIDESGNKIKICTEKRTKVDLSQAKVYVRPWNKSKTAIDLLALSENPFTYNKDNHKSDFYTDINLCKVNNGNHGIHIANYLKKGTIESDVYDIKLLYPHCTTDGLKWYNSHTGESLGDVYDFRIAAAYSVAQLRDKISTGACSVTTK